MADLTSGLMAHDKVSENIASFRFHWAWFYFKGPFLIGVFNGPGGRKRPRSDTIHVVDWLTLHERAVLGEDIDALPVMVSQEELDNIALETMAAQVSREVDKRLGVAS